VRLDRFLARAAVTPPVVVVQVGFANGLGVIRDLAREGVPVLALDPRPRAVGLRSRFAAGMVCPDPKLDAEAFVVFLEALGRRLPRRAVVFPTHDESVWPLSRHAERLAPWYIIPFSRWDTMARLYDKRAQMEAAWRCGVDTPKTVFVDAASDLDRAADEIGFPAILKPVESLAFKLRFRRHVLEVHDRAGLDEAYATVADCGTLMYQEIVPGGDDALYTVGSYLDAGSRPMAVFTGHKLRQHPPRFGVCRMGVSAWDAGLAEAGVRLLRELGYWGVSQVEFKRDADDGRYCLMEVNARHWMWHSLATVCRVNLSHVAYADAIGRPYTAPRQVDGPRWAIAITDTRDAVREVARGEIDLLPWLASYRGVRQDGVLSFADPVPGALILGRQLRNVARARFATRDEAKP
jgi:predicted ATP-grasp superfamily ATP-dependent carboligase